MESGEGRRHRHGLVPLDALISREMKNEKMEKPTVRYGHATQSRKGEDYLLIKTDCQRVPGNPSSTFSVFAIFDGHNGGVASSFTSGISCWICKNRARRGESERRRERKP